ncbi:MAG: hypothetical protein ABH875_01750 [Candidatus Omnitrophota bacterium]
MSFNHRGFTLVEVFLVAMLMGVLLLTIFSSYVAGAKIWRSARELQLSQDRRFHISIAKIRRELKGYLRDFEDIELEGGEREFTFPAIAGTDIVKVTYIFNRPQKAFLRKSFIYSESLKDKMAEKTTELFKADDVKIAYLFSEWTDSEEFINWSDGFSREYGVELDAVRLNVSREGEESSIYVYMPQ